jgi:hypothetical protein
MSLQQWADNGWLRRHETSPKEIDNLLKIVERDLRDVKEGSVSYDWQFGIAYNAALKLCAILLYAQGYKAERNLRHYRTIQALPIILGKEMNPNAQYLDTCRAKRNIAEYDQIGVVSRGEAEELILFVEELREIVLQWLKKSHPELRSFTESG